MSLDELARKLEEGGSKKGGEDMRYKVLMEFLTSGGNMDSKTALPNAAAFASAEYILDALEDEYATSKGDNGYDEFHPKTKMMKLLNKYKVLVPSEHGNSRQAVERMMKTLQKEDEERGKSILDRLNQK